MTAIECYGMTDAGGVSGDNEDAFVTDAGQGICVVADGMGGRSGGALAGRTAAAALHAALAALPPEMRLESSALRGAMTDANQAVRAAAALDPMLEGMGAAVSAVAVSQGRCGVVHIGDCRVYLLRGGTLRQLTQDHTLVAELVARNHLSPEGALRHPLRHVLAKSVGTGDAVEADTATLELSPGDLLLLATDGLTKGLDEADILAALSVRGSSRLQDACRVLMNQALQNDPGDNITVVLVRYPAPGSNGCESGV
ncbi:MAG: serine/threonine-protein phosphatase [Acidobacteria bacterium]|nr:serine/threonine-protein phosphatase [Acidobacteriota bacterium]